MKFLIILSIAVTSFAAIAQPSFEDKKKMMTEHLDKKIIRLNQAKDCVTAASDDSGLKNCKESLKADMKKMWEEKKEHRKAMRKN